jgi:hypothetical protein
MKLIKPAKLSGILGIADLGSINNRTQNEKKEEVKEEKKIENLPYPYDETFERL